MKIQASRTLLRHNTNYPAPARLSDDELIVFKTNNICGNCTPFVLSFFALMAKGLSMESSDMACPCEKGQGFSKDYL